MARKLCLVLLCAMVALTWSKPEIQGVQLTKPEPTRKVPVPNVRQLEFMEAELSQFMHYSLPTYWDGPHNITYHNCFTTKSDHGNQTGSYYPCLDPILFDPPELDPEQWVQASMAMGIKEMCLTAKHEGGFTLWPSKYTPYSVKLAKNFEGGNGDVLRKFADACNKYGMKICYYLNVQKDGYLVEVMKVTADDFGKRMQGMIEEVVTNYGPVNRFWFDGTKDYPVGTSPDAFPKAWAKVYDIIRTKSPETLISPYRGDVCNFKEADGSLYMRTGPKPNSTWDINTEANDPLTCGKADELGEYFIPKEAHGVTFQEGLSGNENVYPTFWFYHPWIGHANASRLYYDWKNIVGHGLHMIINIPPARSGKMPDSYVKVMAEFGQAVKDSYSTPLAKIGPVSTTCDKPVELAIPANTNFDLVVTSEDMTYGQRVANYSIEYQRQGSSSWEVLVPVVTKNPSFRDTPNGKEPRDSRVGYKRIDVPVVKTTTDIAKIRFTCYKAYENPLYIKQFAVFKEVLPWA